MSKAILVLDDMPDACCSGKKNCDLFVETDYGFMCAKTGKEVQWEQKPDWCPLIPDYRIYVDDYNVEKHNQEIDDWLTEGSCSSIGEVFTQIWNECVDRILGEEEE